MCVRERQREKNIVELREGLCFLLSAVTFLRNHACVCVCVYVRVYERERERERTCVCVCMCVCDLLGGGMHVLVGVYVCVVSLI